MSNDPIYTAFDLAKSYLWGLDISGTLQGAGGVGGLLSETQFDIPNSTFAIHYPAYDGNGNVTEYLSQSGAVKAHFEYDPFGNLTADSESNAASFPYRFSTKPQEATTGLYYYGYRYYDPVTGRWPSRDPIEERGGVNLHEFVGNDAVNQWDYLGLIFNNPERLPKKRKPQAGPLPPLPNRRGIVCECALTAKCTPRVSLDPKDAPCDEGDCPTVRAEGVGGPFLNIVESLGAAKNSLWENGDAKCGDICTFGEMVNDDHCKCGEV